MMKSLDALALGPSECGLTEQRGDPSTLRVTEIAPDDRIIAFDAVGLWQYRGLLRVLILRDLKVLYRQTALGACWAIAQPLFTVLIFTVIFGHFAKIPTDGAPYALFAGSAVVLWTYFAEAVRRSANGLVAEAELIRKIYFPRLVIPLATVISPMVDFAIALAVMLALMVWYGVVPDWHLVLAVPTLIVTAMLALGVSLWLGPINVRFRDVKHTLPFLIQIWMYASPIVYASSIVPASVRWLYALNPMVGLIEAFRFAVLGGTPPDAFAITVSVTAAFVLLVSGLIFFQRMERSFADVI
ncbi:MULTISPECIES: ABC transporter permease [Methylobacterium]|jgi:lipopolysaccharide transport system permease protein|uniref:Transport permease protein n=1 Tax=Methylobacterium fujisawaense TaxID=107400 RepID=A0ABR6D5X3_9HYPH|nr:MULTISPECIES: ABC transporter permease [Methylobacterium]KOX56193.1 phosphate ABC transporter permease [Streptomyces purpurogeneiscleroticus]AWV15550.1 phosphate ABC transporter permease [Methylobacterium sp. XJLW]MBA9061468.1 lipopolysaccharide transport system permease protein [Methylobacterium fujisawaense]MBP33919.1 phosphate ABC transporter permease [Methylobacterium sp.]MDE4910818.1 ABC transporter permease [Methylobacterium sp. 092160098-2]